MRFHLFDLPTHHADTFDRQIIAQALADDLAVVTPDNAFHLYKGLKVAALAATAGRSMGRDVAQGEVHPAPRISRTGSRSFNYPISVFAEWRGRAFYLSVRTALAAARRVQLASLAIAWTNLLREARDALCDVWRRESRSREFLPKVWERTCSGAVLGVPHAVSPKLRHLSTTPRPPQRSTSSGC